MAPGTRRRSTAGPFAVIFSGDTRADGVPYMAQVTDAGTLVAVPNPGGRAPVGALCWHRALKRWVGMGCYLSTPGLYMSASAAISEMFPGATWTAKNGRSARENPYSFAYNYACQMPDGGVALITYDGADTQFRVEIIDASGALSVASVLALPGEPSRIFCPRGGTRLFVWCWNGAANNPLYWADAPYNAWTLCTGTDTGYHNEFALLARSSATELRALRPWVRYGPSSGSQDEIWQSHDNGASWSLLSQPWGIYGALTADARSALEPSRINGRWYWTTYGDVNAPVFISTADLVTFETTSIPVGQNRGAPGQFAGSPIPDQFFMRGTNPATAWATSSGLVALKRTAGAIAYDDAVAEFPSPGGFPGNTQYAPRDDRAWAFEL